jgi:hypothetical protein
MLEIEHATMNTEAKGRLAEIRSQLGLEAPKEEAAEAVAEGQAQPQAEGS